MDSVHPDRKANLEVYVEAWLTEDEYREAKAQCILSWQESPTPKGSTEPETPPLTTPVRFIFLTFPHYHRIPLVILYCCRYLILTYTSFHRPQLHPLLVSPKPPLQVVQANTSFGNPPLPLPPLRTMIIHSKLPPKLKHLMVMLSLIIK